MGHDRLLKYSQEGCSIGFEAVLDLTRPYLPGGVESRLTSAFAHVEQLRYTARCAQCNEANVLGRPGDQNSIWAHKFYCLSCLTTKSTAKCEACGEANKH